nr:serine/threonine-protein kinase [Actinomyces oris]
MLDHKGPPPVISGFTYLERLGAGGYSTVYLFEQHMPRREVAVKVMNADVEDKTASRFESEANLMARVSSHPAILSIYGAGVSADGHPFLVMEYCPPPQLGAILRQGPLNVAETLSTAIQIAGAVETAHRAGIVHRDIKPANILFTTYRRPVLSDFGISAMSGPEGAEELRGMSVPWAPPEQLVGMRSANPASDIYSLGATTFAMLTGHSPFETDGIPDVYELSRRIVKDPLPPLGRQDAPPSLHRVLSVAMDKNPDSRYPTALAFARALQQVQAELDLPITTVDLFQEPDKAAKSARRPNPDEADTATKMGVFNQVDVTSEHIAMRVEPDSEDNGSSSDSEAGEPSRPNRMRAVLTGLLVVAMIAAVIAAIVVSQNQDKRKKPNNPIATIAPQPDANPLQASVPMVGDIVGEAQGDGTVKFTWGEPETNWSGSYLYRVKLPDEETELDSVRTNEVVVDAQPARTCLEVTAVRSDGKASPAKTACVDTP